MKRCNTFQTVLCIQDVFDEFAQLFTKGITYEVEISKRGEWRTKNDQCPDSIPYNHTILTHNQEDKVWFSKHFKLKKG